MPQTEGPLDHPPEARPADVLGRSVTGAASTALAGLLGRGAGLLTTVLVTHFISKAEYGHANLALIVAALVNLVTLLSPQQALLTRREGFERAARLVHLFAAWSGVLVAGLLALSARRLLTALGQPEATPLLYVYCVALALERLGVIPALELRYRLRFAEVVRMEVAGDLCYVTVTIGAAMLGAGPLCLPLGMVARHGARLAVLLGELGRMVWPLPVRRLGAEERSAITEVFRYSLPMYVGTLGEIATLYLDNVFVGTVYSPAAQGLYAVGYTLVMTPTDTIARYGANAMVRALGIPDVALRQRAFLNGLRYMALLLFPIGVGAAQVARTLEGAFFPPRWHGVAELVIALSAGAMTLGFFQLTFTQLTALHHPRAGGLIPTVRLLFFGLGLFLVARWDTQRQHLTSVAWAVSGAFVLGALLGLFLSMRVDRLRLRDVARALAPAVLGSAVMGFGLAVAQHGLAWLNVPLSPLRLALEVLLGASLYAAYVRLGHASLWAETTSWLRMRLRPAP